MAARIRHFVCVCVVKVTSNGTVCHSTECLVNGSSVKVMPVAESRTSHLHIANLQANKSLSASLPDLASPSDEFRGLY